MQEQLEARTGELTEAQRQADEARRQFAEVQRQVIEAREQQTAASEGPTTGRGLVATRCTSPPALTKATAWLLAARCTTRPCCARARGGQLGPAVTPRDAERAGPFLGRVLIKSQLAIKTRGAR